MKRFFPLFIGVLLAYTLPSEGLSHQQAVQKKISYLSHFKGITGIMDVEDGVLHIHDDLRLQANKAYVENRTDCGIKIVAHGNVMVNYRAKILICDYLEYYEDTDSCLLTNGRCSLYPWFIGGSTITISPSSIIIHKGYISTSEGPQKHICLSGDYLKYSSDSVLSMGPSRLSICNTPVLLLPQISIMPMEIPKPPITFRGGSGGFLGSYLGVSYSPISKKHCSTTLFLDGFFKHGIGLGYNMRFSSQENPSNAINIKSYYAHRLAIDSSGAKDRYRLHGDFTFSKERAHLAGEFHLSDSWETVVDIFPNNFSLKNTGPTEVSLSWRDNNLFGKMTSSVKVNSFQNVKQELPQAILHHRPVRIRRSRIFLENRLEAGFLDFHFSSNIPGSNFSSWRFSSAHKVYRGLVLPIGTLTPSLSGTAIYYTRMLSPNAAHCQLSGSLSFDYRVALQKEYRHARHIVEPFCSFLKTTRPVLSSDEPHIFSIKDAFHSINLLHVGLESKVLNKHSTPSHLKLWTTYIFDEPHAKDTFPKTACWFSLPLTLQNTLSLDAEWIWKKSRWDHLNVIWEWILNDNLGLTLEFLHRSKYGFIKCAKDNYTLDVSRSLDTLLASPLSDRRNLITGKLFVRPHPHWNYNLNLRYGWHRPDSPSYLEYQMILGHKIFEHWQLFSVYEKREADKRCFFYLKLDKRKQKHRHPFG
ncbi:Organic solvent tolerance protein OstA [Chlamydia trachomatis]|uniref:CT351 family outer membrane beta-barrel protein n=1 Tax=Chlamydia trachomatis TaxID=813 RepID=UPI0008FF102F|nr:Organic solvent tolerance protein OstA [Chlamydia trachomatis]APD40040.1 Organic solvent tolerance protein OstA [Chlamydia trachomatis]